MTFINNNNNNNDQHRHNVLTLEGVTPSVI